MYNRNTITAIKHCRGINVFLHWKYKSCLWLGILLSSKRPLSSDNTLFHWHLKYILNILYIYVQFRMRRLEQVLLQWKGIHYYILNSITMWPGSAIRSSWEALHLLSLYIHCWLYSMLWIFPVLITNISPTLLLYDAHFNLHTMEITLITKMFTKYFLKPK